jgi:hypothetical protein
MRKNELYKPTCATEIQRDGYKTDHTAVKYCHTVATLPPYLCDLNPVELAWAKTKTIVPENSVTGDTSLQKLQVTKDAMTLVTKEEWVGDIQKHPKANTGKETASLQM